MDAKDREREHGSAEATDRAADEDLHLWGRESTRADFIKGHYGEHPGEPTPEGGQAGIAQGNVFAQGTVAAPNEREQTFAERDQYSQTGETEPADMLEDYDAHRDVRPIEEESPTTPE
jgi:hypothetical protein